MFKGAYTLWALGHIVLLFIYIDRSFGASTKRSQRHVGPTLDTDDYYSYEGMMEYLDDLSNAYSQRVVLRNVGRSYENRTLKTITITNGDGRTGKKAIFVVGAEHAREWLTPLAALYAVEQLVVHYQQHANLLLDYDWIIMPLVNPDGYTYSRSIDKMWRNTRSSNGGNCFGTNINRNYDIGWGTGYPAITNPCHDHYAGSKPFSEPETRAVRDIMLDLVNTKRAVMYISLHSHHTTVFYPWVYKNTPADNDKHLSEIAKVGAEAMQQAFGTSYSYEQAGQDDSFGGTSLDYAYAKGFPLSYTLELSGHRGDNQFDFFPPTALLQELAEESWMGIRAMAEKAIEYYPLNDSKSAVNRSSLHSLSNIFKLILIMAVIISNGNKGF